MHLNDYFYHYLLRYSLGVPSKSVNEYFNKKRKAKHIYHRYFKYIEFFYNSTFMMKSPIV